jgi:Fic family protein
MESGRYVKLLTGHNAFIPHPLPPATPLKIDKEMTDLLFQANNSLLRLDSLGYALPDYENFIGTYIQKEALLSSQIEGTRATMEDLFISGNVSPVKRNREVIPVFNYIEALKHGRKRLQELPMCLRLIREMHEILLQGAEGGSKNPGQVRTAPVIIGGTSGYVPPPADELGGLLSDFEKYLNEENEEHPLIKCALIHYQFEAIHPFLDGNGRIGRLLITLYLLWKNIIEEPLLYLSYYFKKYRQEYYDRLNWVSSKGDFEQWVMFFLKGIVETASSALKTARNIIDLRDRHRKLLLRGKKVSTTALLLFEDLFSTPFVSIEDIQERYDVSHTTGSAIIKSFKDMGILKEDLIDRKRKNQFKYVEYLKILSEGTEL